MAALLVNYCLWVPVLIDQYLSSRFIWMSLVNLFGCLWILPRVKKLDFQLLDGLLLAFYGLNLLSLAWAENFGEAIFSIQRYHLLFLCYYILRHALADLKSHQKLVANLLWICTVVAIGITGMQFVQTYLGEGLGGKAVYKIIGNSGHKNLAASFLFLLLGFNLYFISLDRKIKAWHYWLLGLQLILIILLRSRAVYIAIAASSAYGLGKYFLVNAQSRKLLYRQVLPFAALVAVIGGLFIANSEAGKDYLPYFNPATYQKSASGSERLFVWYKTFELIGERPLQGYGSGNWKLFFPSNNIAGGFRLQEQDLIFTRVHNDYLEIGAEVGIFGLLLFVGIFGLAFWALRHAGQTAAEDSKLSIYILSAIILGYCVVSFFDFPKERIEHQVMLALTLALAAIHGKDFFQKGRFHRVWKGQSKMIVIGLLLASLAINLPIGYYRYQGDVHSKKVIIAMAVKDNKMLRESSVAGNSIWYNLNSMVIPFKWYEGLSYYFEENFQEARKHLAEAYRLNPYNFNVLNNYASTLVQVGAYEESIPIYQAALQINPKFDEGLFNMAVAYYHLGRLQESLDCIERTQTNPEKKELFLNQVRSAMSQRTN
ncbi:MAG: O-antigen ligase family protein [Bacteroidota bacterium]